jgi:hypothetical protein
LASASRLAIFSANNSLHLRNQHPFDGSYCWGGRKRYHHVNSHKTTSAQQEVEVGGVNDPSPLAAGRGALDLEADINNNNDNTSSSSNHEEESSIATELANNLSKTTTTKNNIDNQSIVPSIRVYVHSIYRNNIGIRNSQKPILRIESIRSNTSDHHSSIDNTIGGNVYKAVQ